MMKTGLFGGTFNPPHIGHISVADKAVESLGLDRLIVMPTGTPPHKELSDGAPDAEARLEMAKLAFADTPRAEVSDMEIRREGRSYTADTVRAILAKSPETELWLVVGDDMFFSFERWYDSRWLLANVSLAVFARSDRMDEIRSRAEKMRAGGARVRVVEKEVVEISSTEIRDALPKRGGRKYLSDPVYSYIIRNRLYNALPDIDWLRGRAITLLKPSRVPHVLGTEETAAALARRWGVDEADARTAALLHDCTKRINADEQLNFESLHVTMQTNPVPEKLFHAITGAELAQREFGVSDEIRSAIRWHTSGKPGMTDLEKIIYLADMVEPNRTFPEALRIRDVCFEDLDAAMRDALEFSVKSVKERNLPLDETTVRALEYYRGTAK
ncbi:MAG: nicotinate (nicotinamide) nucleotide adenylyltransferase [Oscillospiraceae bacterium]|nr:nicotinate (nicotinamide) nucleotide adenylyltransferase [Oscillospiraceae bacterium]